MRKRKRERAKIRLSREILKLKDLKKWRKELTIVKLDG